MMTYIVINIRHRVRRELGQLWLVTMGTAGLVHLLQDCIHQLWGGREGLREGGIEGGREGNKNQFLSPLLLNSMAKQGYGIT